MLTWVPKLPLLASAGWGRACKRVAAALAWVSRAFLSTLMCTASDVLRLACALAVLTMALMSEMSMEYAFWCLDIAFVIGTLAQK